jgi:hypothetical protein
MNQCNQACCSHLGHGRGEIELIDGGTTGIVDRMGREANHADPEIKRTSARAVNAASRQPAKGVAYVHRDHFDLLFA